MKKSAKVFRVGLIISIIIFLIGLFIFLPNIENLKYTTFFGHDITKEFQEMGAFYIPYDGFDMMKSSGNMAVVGIAFMAGSVIALLISYLISNNQKLVENSETQVAILSKQEPISKAENSISEKLSQLNELKRNELISEEEYNQKRQEILSKF